MDGVPLAFFEMIYRYVLNCVGRVVKLFCRVLIIISSIIVVKVPLILNDRSVL